MLCAFARNSALFTISRSIELPEAEARVVAAAAAAAADAAADAATSVVPSRPAGWPTTRRFRFDGAIAGYIQVAE